MLSSRLAVVSNELKSTATKGDRSLLDNVLTNVLMNRRDTKASNSPHHCQNMMAIFEQFNMKGRLIWNCSNMMRYQPKLKTNQQKNDNTLKNH